MKLLFVLLFTSMCCYAQQEDITEKVKQIDDMSQNNSIALRTCGSIFKKRFLLGKKTIGGFSNQVYCTKPANGVQYKNDSPSIIKGKYTETNFITKNSTEYLDATFYYDNDKLFFVCIEKGIKNKNAEPVSEIYNIEPGKDISPEISEKLGFDIAEWINNRKILFEEMRDQMKGLTTMTY